MPAVEQQQAAGQGFAAGYADILPACQRETGQVNNIHPLGLGLRTADRLASGGDVFQLFCQRLFVFRHHLLVLFGNFLLTHVEVGFLVSIQPEIRRDQRNKYNQQNQQNAQELAVWIRPFCSGHHGHPFRAERRQLSLQKNPKFRIIYNRFVISCQSFWHDLAGVSQIFMVYGLLKLLERARITPPLPDHPPCGWRNTARPSWS